MHDLSLIATIAAALTAAWLLGLLTQWLRLSPIVGYLLAGVIIGPHTPGFVGDVHLATQLAEVGVILLMFGVGLHFHLKDLLAVKAIAIPGAVVQSALATLVAMVVFQAFGMPLKTGAVLGMAMAVASTVVLMRVLMDADVLDAPQGHAAVGWLVVEDLFTVILLVLIPVLGAGPDVGAVTAGGGFWGTLGLAMLKLVVLVALLFWAGSRIIPWILVKVARLRSRELFTLTVLVFSVAVAAGSYFFFGASMALGAFLAGMVVAQSPVSHQAAADALPMRDTFAVLFFVSVGMLFDPAYLIKEPGMIAAALGVILVVKPFAALLIVALLGHPLRTGLTVAVGLAQIGEFSFILSDLARQHKLMPDEGHNVLVAAAILSITLNPLLFRMLPQMEAWIDARPELKRLLASRAERRLARTTPAAPAEALGADGEGRLAIVVGYGPVGRSVHRVLKDSGMTVRIVDLNMETVSGLRTQGETAIFGDASNRSILEEAGIRQASHLVVTVPDAGQRAAVIAAARDFGTRLRIVVRARYLSERGDLEKAGASAAVFEEGEAAVALSRMVLADTGTRADALDGRVQDIRLRLIMENVDHIRSQPVGTILVPWQRVRTLDAGLARDEVLALVARHRFSRWPVLREGAALPLGYLLVKDLLSHDPCRPWTELLRPLRSVKAGTSIHSVLEMMQSEGATLALVESGGSILGMVSMEDILEQVVGKLDDEQEREATVSLAAALGRGAVLPGLQARQHEAVIGELVLGVPAASLPAGMEREQVREWVLAREEEISTDLGNGIAVPHARIPGLDAPVLVLGHSRDGVRHAPESPEPVRLYFLILSPAEHPEHQLTLLAQVARMARDASAMKGLLRSASAKEFEEQVRRHCQFH